MILKGDSIHARMTTTNHEKRFVITPSPDPTEIKDKGSASIDLRLGTWFVSLRPARAPFLPVEGGPGEAELTKTQYVPFGTAFYLHPRSFVLGTTLQWLHLPGDLSGYVVGKSSWGRRGLIIATAIGVHPGFTGCLTLELSNVGEMPIELKPGTEVCQLFLESVETEDISRIEQTQFAGSRKPALGRPQVDKFADNLARRTLGAEPNR